MWIDKEGRPYTGGGVVIDNKRHWFPTPEQFIEAGFHWEEPTPPPKRYSKRKIIDALGDAWEAKKAELIAAGFYDKFVNSTYLCIDDPDFAAYYETLSDEEKAMLEECLYDE